MTGTIKRTTTHYNMRIPIFDAPGWGREIERNLDILDAVVFAATNFSLVKGLWTNSTLYNVGDRVVDEDTNTIWECLVQHTSPATGSFEDDRTANPTYWQIVSTIVQNRGVWQPSTTYKYNDFVEYDNKVAVTVVPSYTSGASFDDDVANNNLHVVIDLGPQLTAASASAGAAAASALAAQSSEANAASSASAAAISEANAASSASAANTSAGNASASASSASSSANAAAGSAIAAAASAVDASNAKSAAEGYATNAQNAANAAAATYISFDKRYLGEKSSNPATDNQGQPLAVGALYWNTTTGRMMVYDGAAWQYTAVDASLFVLKSGDTMSGALQVRQYLTLKANPTGNVGIVILDNADNEVGLIFSTPSTGYFAIRRARGGSYDTLALQADGRLTYNGQRLITTADMDPWAMQPIGVPIPVLDHISGVTPPPTNKSYRYVKMSAGETGAGGYNEGILTNETVSGSAPLISAIATINLPASPMHGKAFRLINTERRFIRPGPSGEIQDDAFQSHLHGPPPGVTGYVTWQSNSLGSGGSVVMGVHSNTGGPVEHSGYGVPRVSTETRPRNVGATYYMRIL